MGRRAPTMLAMVFDALLDALLDLVLPADCAGCGGFAGPLCPRCRAALAAPAAPTAPDPRPERLPPCWAVARYDGVVRDTLLAYKERGRRAVCGPLGAALARAVAAAVPGDTPAGAPLLLVPIPSARRAARRRGGDHVRRLARIAARDLAAQGRQLRVAPLLSLRRGIADSAGLGAAERARNLRGAFAVRAQDRPVPAAAVLILVDDLVTTGATLAAAASALTDAGHCPAAAAVVAATARWRRQGLYRG